MNIYTPYTYLIGWSWLNIWYYGSRYAKNCHPSDLWVSYFTSSKHVERFRKEYGEPDVIEIRKVFDFREQCILWENKVLSKMNIGQDERFLNKTNNKAIFLTESERKYIGKKIKEIRIKNGSYVAWNKGLKLGPMSEENKNKLRGPRSPYGKQNNPYSDRNKPKGSKPNLKGWETRRKNGFVCDTSLNINKKIECPVCGKITNAGNIGRWHKHL